MCTGATLRVAILEDDADQAELTRRWLTNAEYSVDCYPDAGSFLRAVRRESFDLYVLDWVLPDSSGIEVLQTLRSEMADFTPAVIATAKDKEQSIVRGLEAGADDYLVKPIRQAELVARLAAIHRRTGAVAGGNQLEVAPYAISASGKSLSLRDEAINLTNREFELAYFLFRNAGKILSRSHILEAIWGIDNKSVSTRTVDTHMSRLRKKLDLCDENGWKLSAIYQHGYRLERINS